MANRQLLMMSVGTLAHLLAVAVTLLVFTWLLHFRPGLAFRSHNMQKIFDVHPLLMTVGMILIGGEAILAYKVVPAAKAVQKKVHLTLHFLALMSGIVGIYAVFDFHDKTRTPHLYTLHSWIGIITICLYGLQWIFSFIIFAVQKVKAETRAAVVPWHLFSGTVIFLLAIGAALTGFLEKFTFLQLQRSQEALIMNFTGLLIMMFAVLVGLGVTLPRMD